MASQPVQPSPPVTPIEEEDISRAGVYNEQPKTTRNKGKQRAEDPFDEEDPQISSEGSNAEERYPPVNDEEAESRRVAENLRRWEMAERQRRKAARESTASSTGGGSIVGDVARRASFLWQTRRSKQPAPQGPGTHHKLHNSEDEVALDDIDNQLSAPPSPMPPEDPFKTPAASTVSLNDPQHSAIMSEAATVTLKSPKADEELLAAPPARPGKLDRKKSLREHPPPQPLDLPEPRSPPPPAGTPAADRPPEPIPPPSTTARQDPEPEEEHVPEKRWWTDWLCGCREDGDKQAGRTNPFE